MRKEAGIIVCVIASMFLLLISTASIYAASVTSKLHVQVTILPTLDYRIIESRDLHITQADIKKGYKNVENGTILSISTNDTNGYVLSVSSQELFGYGDVEFDENLYTSVTITIDGNAYTIPAGGSVDIPIPYEGMGHKIKRLSYSFQLAPEAPKGTYNLPIMLTPFPL